MDRRFATYAVVFAALLGTAQAQESGWYAGGSIGGAAVEFGDNFLSHPASNGPETFTKDEESNGFKAYVGKRLYRHFALEGGYADFGSFTASRSFTSLALFGPGAIGYKLEARGLFVDAMGILPVADRFNVFAKAGLVYAMTKATVRESGSVAVAAPRFSGGGSEEEITPKLGLGASLRLGQRFDVRFEMEQVFAVGDEDSTGEGDIRMVSIGVSYRF